MSHEARRRVVILGAAGRDFHDFNVVYREDTSVEVVAFTATQIPGIEGRRYPPSLAGPLYPEGIPIVDESQLTELCEREKVDEAVFAYSDVPHQHVMHVGSRAMAAGADFKLLGPRSTMLRAERPVLSVCAVRTGCGKSQTSRWISQRLSRAGVKVAVLRHPMPYGHLENQAVQRFETLADLDAAGCTAEEREEYEPHLALGHVVYAGIDYRAILDRAQEEAQAIIWDGGNNDFSFVRPDLAIALVDALRPEQVTTHHPGEVVLRTAHVVVVNKVGAERTGSGGETGVDAESTARLIERVRAVNPDATIIRAASPVRLDDAQAIRGKRVLVVEDGPTITHGGMPHGAGLVAAQGAGAKEIVDPRSSLAPELAQVYERYPHIGPVLPAMGYGASQIAALRKSIEASRAEVVVCGTPIDLAGLLALDLPVVRARYELEELDDPGLGAVVDRFIRERLHAAGGHQEGSS